MEITPARIDNEDEVMKKVLAWRNKRHKYENPKPFTGLEGQSLRPLFCNKCGFSKDNVVHIKQNK